MGRSQGTLFHVADHSNRGKQFERELMAVHDVYRLHGRADIVKNAEAWEYISEKEYLEKLQLIAQKKYSLGTLAVTDSNRKMKRFESDVDFSGGGTSFSVCFDAKETESKRIPIAQLKAHQIHRLVLSSRCGTIAGFMIKFVVETRVFFAPALYVRARENTLLAQRGRRARAGTASISIPDLEKKGMEIFRNNSGMWDWMPALVK